jgi:hypothetical protein
VQPIPLSAQAAPLVRVAALVVPAKDAQVVRHISDQSDRQHDGEARACCERLCGGASVEPGCSNKARRDGRRHEKRVHAREAPVHQLLGADLRVVIELPERRVHDAPGRQLAAGEETGEHDGDEGARIHRL